MKSSKVSGSGTGEIYTPSWKWFTLLEFLKDSICPVKARPTPEVPQDTLDETENIEPSTSALGDEEEDESTMRKLQSQVQTHNKSMQRT